MDGIVPGGVMSCHVMQAGLVGSSWPCKYLILPSGLWLYRQTFVSAEFHYSQGKNDGLDPGRHW